MTYIRKLPIDYLNYVPYKIRYGARASNPDGTEEDLTRCVEWVWDKFSWGGRQCYRKRGYGYKGLFCKQHSKEYENPEESE